MAKKQAIKIADDTEDEQLVNGDLDSDDEDESTEPDNLPLGMNKSDLIREAVDAGYGKPAAGVAYIKRRYGADIDSKYFSIVKSKIAKRPETFSAETPTHPGPQSSASGSVPTSLIDDLKQLRQIKDRYGDDFQKIVDAIG